MSETTMSTLLNPNNMYYLINEKVWKFGGGDIYNDQGQKLGRMHRVLLSLRADIELEDPDGSKIAKVRRKIVALRPQFDILDMKDNILGCTKQKLTALIHPEIWMEDNQGQRVYTAKGNFMRWDFDIYANDQKVAEIKKADKWRDVFLKGVFNLKDTYAIHITHPGVDRLGLLSFAIAIDNTFHDDSNKKNR